MDLSVPSQHVLFAICRLTVALERATASGEDFFLLMTALRQAAIGGDENALGLAQDGIWAILDSGLCPEGSEERGRMLSLRELAWISGRDDRPAEQTAAPPPPDTRLQHP